MTRMSSRTALLIILLPAVFNGQSRPVFDEQTLRFESGISRPVLEDVNGDGFPDLIVAQCAESGKTWKRISFFLNREGRFGSSPDHSILLRNGEAIYDLADTDGDSDLELLVMGDHGVFAYEPAESGLNDSADTILVSPTILPAVSTEPPIRWPFASCFPRGGFTPLCVPESDGIGVYSRTSTDGYRRVYGVNLTSSQVRTMDGTPPGFFTELPELKSFGPDPGTVVIDRGHAVFLETGAFDSSCVKSPMQEFRFPRPSSSRDSLDTAIQQEKLFEFDDFNGDGFTDVLVFLSPHPGIFTPPGQVRLYLNRLGRWSAIPDQILIKDCFFGNHVTADFNRDGLPDLCLITLETSVFDFARYVLGRKVRNRYDIHFGRKDETFHPKPDRSVVFARKQTLKELFTKQLVEQPMAGDFNGDGIMDVAVWTGQMELSMIIGNEKDGLKTGHPDRITLQRAESVLIEDINRDGLSDLVLLYPDLRGMVVRLLVFSAGGGSN